MGFYLNTEFLSAGRDLSNEIRDLSSHWDSFESGGSLELESDGSDVFLDSDVGVMDSIFDRISGNDQAIQINQTSQNPAQDSKAQTAMRNPKEVAASVTGNAPKMAMQTALDNNRLAQNVQSSHQKVNGNVQNAGQTMGQVRAAAEQEFKAGMNGQDNGPQAQGGMGRIMGHMGDLGMSAVAGMAFGPAGSILATAVSLAAAKLASDGAGKGSQVTFNQNSGDTPTYVSKADAKKGLDRTGYGQSESTPSLMQTNQPGQSAPQPFDCGRAEIASATCKDEYLRLVMDTPECRELQSNLSHYKDIQAGLSARAQNGVHLGKENNLAMAQNLGLDIDRERPVMCGMTA